MNTKTRSIPRAWIGRTVDWHGFDGKHYTAHVDAIRCGIAVLSYFPMLATGERVAVVAYAGATTWAQRVNQAAS